MGNPVIFRAISAYKQCRALLTKSDGDISEKLAILIRERILMTAVL
jgi:hypothetical protein